MIVRIIVDNIIQVKIKFKTLYSFLNSYASSDDFLTISLNVKLGFYIKFISKKKTPYKENINIPIIGQIANSIL